MRRLENKVAMITGASRGIGLATAETLALEGASVVLLARDARRASAVAANLESEGCCALGLPLDVTQEASWEAACVATLERFGRLDVLVNNAGVFLRRPLDAQTLEEWRSVQSPNVEGVFLGMKHGIRAMASGKTTPQGVIVNMSAIGGLIGTPFTTAYGASKAAVRYMTKCAALEVAQLGYKIRINSIHPALVQTDMAESVIESFSRTMAGEASRESAEHLLRQNYPMGRFGTAEEIARSILFLVSDDSSFMTGAELVVDGGYTAR